MAKPASPIYDPIAAPPGTVGYWLLHEGTGSASENLAGETGNLTLSGHSWESRTEGPFVRFTGQGSGTTGLQRIGGTGLFATTGESFTAFVAFRLADLSVLHTILSRRAPASGSSATFWVGVATTGAISTRLRGTAGAATAAAAISAATWYTLAITWDGSATVAYLNGSATGTNPAVGTAAEQAHNIKIGEYDGTGAATGTDIDFVVICDEALDASAIAALHADWAAGTFAAANGAPDPPPVGYKGRPIIADLSAITPRIVVTRLAATAPALIQCSASDTTWTGPTGGDPYTDLEYSWDFGDDAAAEVFDHPVAAATLGSTLPASVDADTDQVGPEAAYVYRTAGTKTITLSVRGWNGQEMVEASTTTVLVDSQWLVASEGASAGDFTLTAVVDGDGGQTTAAIAYDATIEEIRDAVAALSNVGTGNVRSLGGRLLEFCNDLAGLDVDLSATPGGTYNGTVVLSERAAGASDTGVTVSDFSGTSVYFDSGAAGGGNGSEATPYNDATTLRTQLATSTAGGARRILLKAGSTFDLAALAPTGFNIGGNNLTNPLQVVRYGAGARPVLALADQQAQYLSATNPIAGLTLDGIAVSTAGSVALRFPLTTAAGATPPARRGLHLIDCTFSAASTASNFLILDLADGRDAGIWGCAFSRPAPPDDDTGSHAAAVYLGETARSSCVGCTFEGGGGGANTTGLTHAHHVYWNDVGPSLLRWIDFRPASARVSPDGDGNAYYRLNFCVKLSAKGGHAYPFTVIDGCSFGGTQNGLNVARQNDTAGSAYYDRIVVSGNSFAKGIALGTQDNGIYAPGVGRIAIRDNLFWDYVTGASLKALDDASGPDRVDAAIHRNRAFVASGDQAAWDLRNLAGLEFTDNDTQVLGAKGSNHAALVVDWTDLAALDPAPAIDRNTWHSPDEATGDIFTDLAVGGSTPSKDFADWQGEGYDAAGSVADPDWRDPANGDFRSALAAAYTLSGPGSVLVGGSATLRLQADGTTTADVTLTPSVGSVSPNPVTLDGANEVTATYTAPAEPQSITISAADDGGLTDPADLTINVVEPSGGRRPRYFPGLLRRPGRRLPRARLFGR